MLDKETMAYTCAVFTDPKNTLEEAQLNKLRLVINKVLVELPFYCSYGNRLS